MDEVGLTLCNDLDLSGFGDWRLPSINELRTLLRGCPDLEDNGACGVTDSCLDASCWASADCGCPAGPGPGLDGAFAPPELNGPWGCQNCFYWTSSEITPPPFDREWALHFVVGILGSPVGTIGHARCVRDLP